MADNLFTLEDLKPATLKIEIKQGDQTFTIPLRLLTVGEWQQIGYLVPSPAPPVSGFDKDNKRPIVNTNDPTFLAQQAEAEAKRSAMRLAAALEGGGMDVPGDDMAAKGDTVRKTLDIAIYNALLTTLIEETYGVKGAVVGRAATFRGG